MTQNTEQNVQALREQDGQVQEMHADMVKAVCGRRSDYPEDVFRAYLKRHIVQAEARGAEEQRRKDAEGCEPVGYRHTLNNGVDQNESVTLSEAKDCPWGSLDGWNSAKHTFEPVYTRPANVAALESSLLDPATVHQNMLRGSIAKPEWDQIKHLYAGEFSALEAEIASLKEAEQLARADAEASRARVTVLEGENNTLKTRVINAAENLLSIETPCMKGDNFAVTICSYFEDCEGETCDNGWHEGATNAYEEIKDAVLQHFRAALTREGGV